MAVVDELVTLINYKMDEKGAKVLNDSKNATVALAGKIAGLAAVVLTARAAFSAWMTDTIQHSMELQRLSNDTGTSTESIQEWGYAVGKLGGNARSVQSDIAHLQKTMAEPMMGMPNPELFKLGINVHEGGKLKAPLQMLEELSGKFSHMEQWRAFSWGSRLGLSDDTIRLLIKGKEGIAALKKEAHDMGAIVSGDNIKAAADFWEKLYSLKAAVKGIATEISTTFIPITNDAADAVKKWVVANSDIVKSGVGAIIRGIGEAFQSIGHAISMVWEKIKNFIPGLGQFAAAFGDVNVIAGLVRGVVEGIVILLVPFLASIAQMIIEIAALGLVVDDLISYFEGADSTIGRFFDNFQKKWPAVFEVMKALGTFLKNVIFTVLGDIAKAFVDIADSIKYLSGLGLDVLEKVFKSLGFGQGFNTPNGQTGHTPLMDFKNIMSQPPESVFVPGSNQMSNVVNDNKKVEININGAQSPTATGQAVANELGFATWVNAPGNGMAPVGG